MPDTKIDSIPTVLALAADLYCLLHDRPLKDVHPACWEFVAGEYVFAQNGRGEEVEGGPADGMRCDVPPYSLGVWRNGWLVGFADAGGGILASGTEDEICDALGAAIKAAGGKVPE